MGCYAKILRQWGDDAVVLEVGSDASFPDAIAECVAEVARLEGLIETDADQPED